MKRTLFNHLIEKGKHYAYLTSFGFLAPKYSLVKCSLCFGLANLSAL
jgi:hypothetical protein